MAGSEQREKQDLGPSKYQLLVLFSNSVLQVMISDISWRAEDGGR